MHEPFAKRQSKRAKRRQDGFDLLSVNENLNTVRRRSSEERLAALRPGSWTPLPFVTAARQLAMDGFTLILCGRDDAIPPLGPDVHFKYVRAYAEVPDRRAAGEDLLVAIVIEGDRVVAYGIAARLQAECEIEIIDVDRSSSRSAGLQVQLEIGEETFGVGIGHVVVDQLVSALRGRILVDATGESSRYIFKSLGFVHRPATTNPCLLQLDREPHVFNTGPEPQE
jgi:hypothetical protein